MSQAQHDDLATALRELAASALPPEHEVSTDPRPCPVCGRTMELLKHFDVVMDVCDDHGVWLDQGELALILERTYWHRREAEDVSSYNPGRNMDETRRTFTAGMRRVMGCVARF